jgi:hypothetical protein
LALIFFVTVTAVFLFIKWAGPYGQEYLPQWISKGNDIVTAIDSRENFDENSSWGSYKILDSWMWTKD